MLTLARRAGTGLLAVAAVAGATMISASPAAALTWRCTSSFHSIDQANYSGPQPDQWGFTVKNCAARSGSYVYAKAVIKWDGPLFVSDNWFDGAYYRLVLKKSVPGTDPTVAKKNFEFEGTLENRDVFGNGSYSTGTIKARVNSTKAYADGTLYLDWRHCCGGYKSWGWSASPRV